jgi:DNA-directed RNA polymerase specialized sigma24 family protein
MPPENLTYREIAERLDITPEAARKRVRAKRLPASLGNDGRTRVIVNLDELAADTPPRRSPPAGPSIVELFEMVEALRAEIAQRPTPELVETLKAQIMDLKTDRDRWHAMAQRPWWRRLAN